MTLSAYSWEDYSQGECWTVHVVKTHEKFMIRFPLYVIVDSCGRPLASEHRNEVLCVDISNQTYHNRRCVDFAVLIDVSCCPFINVKSVVTGTDRCSSFVCLCILGWRGNA